MFMMNDQLASMFKNFQPGNEQLTNVLKNMFAVGSQYPATPQNPFAGREQMTDALKTGIENHVSFLNAMAASTLATVEKMVDLNMSAAKATMEESTVITKQLLASKNAQEVQALLNALPQSVSAKATAYNKHVANIASGAQADIAQAVEQQFPAFGNKLSGLMAQMSKSMPTGFESAAAMTKGVIANASAGYQPFSKTTQPAAEAAGAQVSNAADALSQAAEQVPGAGTHLQ